MQTVCSIDGVSQQLAVLPAAAFGLLTLLLTVGACGAASQSPPTSTTEADDPLSVQWELLDGQAVDLVELASKHEALVLYWYGTTCPCVERYHERLDQLRAAWEPRGVAFLLVASNADDSIDELVASVDERGFDLPMVLDRDARLADALDVQTTPTVVLLDERGQRTFVGFIDNWREPDERGREPYLSDALTRLIDSGDHAFATSQTYGCPVTRRR